MYIFGQINYYLFFGSLREYLTRICGGKAAFICDIKIDQNIPDIADYFLFKVGI